MFFTSEPTRTICDYVWKCHRIEALCSSCGRRVSWPSDALKAMFKPEMMVGKIAAGLKCICGSREGKLFSYQDEGATKARDFARYGVEQDRQDAVKAWARRVRS